MVAELAVVAAFAAQFVDTDMVIADTEVADTDTVVASQVAD